jgi:zinc transporter ZupT
VLWRAGRDRRVLAALTGFGAGFLLTVVVIGMLPLAVGSPGGFLAVLGGYLVVHLTQHTLTPHFHFGEETHHEAMVSRGIGVFALVGLLPHSFFDGVAISAGFMESRLGMLIFLGILLHKVPTGVSLASIMIASGNTGRADPRGRHGASAFRHDHRRRGHAGRRADRHATAWPSPPA